MKCDVTSDITQDVMISKEITYKSYKNICGGQPKKVNLGFNNLPGGFEVKNNSLVPIPKELEDFIYDINPYMSYDWEILSKFFSLHNIAPTWLDCQMSWGSYNPHLGGWTGCMGKV